MCYLVVYRIDVFFFRLEVKFSFLRRLDKKEWEEGNNNVY